VVRMPLALFCEMQRTDLKPDHDHLCFLSACSHAGLVEKGWKFFECMSQDYGITPRGKHYACMVDLLGRAGHFG
jgi:pentatricopeptide repeat protein